MVNDGSFAADYAREMTDAFVQIAHGAKTARYIDTVLAKKRRQYRDGFQMYFTTNHDPNSWDGSEMERLGEGHRAFGVLAATLEGTPLLHNGQEAALNRRLKFFDEDTISWGSYACEDF